MTPRSRNSRSISSFMARASLRVRCGAVILDLIVLCFAGAVLLAVFEMAGGFLPRYVHRMVAWAAIFFYTTTEVFPGKSPGHWVMDLVIRSRDGTPASRGRLARRWLFKYAFLLFGAFWESSDLWLPAVWPGPSRTLSTMYIANRLFDIAEMVTMCPAMMIWVGMIGAFLPGRETLHDWLSGTAVFDLQDIRDEPPSAARAFEVTLVSNEDQHSA